MVFSRVELRRIRKIAGYRLNTKAFLDVSNFSTTGRFASR